jgi:PAS domain S-box-containing protein
VDQLPYQISKPESNARSRRLTHACVVVAIVLTGMAGILSWRISQRAAEDAASVAHTYDVTAGLELTLRNLDDVETGARGFALSGQDRFLEPYMSGLYATRLDLEKLHTLISDDPGQQRRFGVLAEQAKTRLEAAADLVKARQNLAKVSDASYLDKGKEVMDKIRASIAGMEDQEALLLEQRTQRARNTRRLTGSAIGLCTILGIVFLFIAGLTVSREIRIAARAQTQVKALNADLEQRVEQRTAALKAESAARLESEGRLAAVIKSAMDTIITVDDEQRIVLFNQAAEKMFQCPQNEAIGRPIKGFIPNMGGLGEGFTNQVIGLKDELWAIRANGEKFQIEASVSENEIAGRQMFTVILRDVTERKRAEHTRDWLAAVVDSSDDAIISKTLDGTIAAWNRGAEKVFGYSASEAVGKPILMLMPPERVGEEADILTRIKGSESVEHFETVRVRKDGMKIDVAVTISPIRDSHGVVVGASKIARDISERKQAEVRLAAQAAEVVHSRQALETQKLMLQSVLNSMVEGLVVTDEQGNFILWNPAAQGILGMGPANLLPADWSAHYGTFLPDMITPFPNGQNPLLLAIAGAVTSAVMFIRNPSLEQGVWIESNGAPLRDKDGLVRGGVIAFRDITRRKADELEIRKLNEELEDRIAKRTEQLAVANQELEAFSYSVSHDLRAPLRHIAGFSRILVNDFGPVMAVEAREYLRLIEDAVRRMGLLVEDLLSLAKLGQQSLKLCRTELNAIVDEVISMLQPDCNGRDVAWRIAKLPALDCDPILMVLVFQNLLGNALKYSRNRAYAVIEVDSIQQPGKPPVIFVRDNGAGFNRKYADRLFGAFQRFHTDSEFEGTGVGLATVHRIIQKHGGTIWAESEPDHGATFYFALQMTDQIVETPKVTAAS